MEVKYVSIFAIVLVLLSGIPLVSGAGMNYADAKYAPDTQSQANANDCDNGANCAINSPQTQGDGTANSLTNLQISKFSDQSEEQPPTQGALPMIRVFKEVICPTGFVCPTPDKFTMKVAVGSPFATAFPNPFPGSNALC